MVGAFLAVAANSVVLLVFFVYFRRRMDRALQSENILRDIRAEVDQMIVELNQTTDRNVGLVEDNLSRLAARIAEADRRIVVLKKETEKVHASNAVYSHLRSAVAPPAPPDRTAKKAPEKRATPPLEKPEEKKSIREQVLELYRSGLEAREIAAKLDKTLGEVDLIIKLGTNRA